MGEGSTGQLALNIKQAVALTGLSRSTLYLALRDGRLKCFRIGARVLFSRDHLASFLKDHETVPPGERPEEPNSVAQRQLQLGASS